MIFRCNLEIRYQFLRSLEPHSLCKIYLPMAYKDQFKNSIALLLPQLAVFDNYPCLNAHILMAPHILNAPATRSLPPPKSMPLNLFM